MFPCTGSNTRTRQGACFVKAGTFRIQTVHFDPCLAYTLATDKLLGRHLQVHFLLPEYNDPSHVDVRCKCTIVTAAMHDRADDCRDARLNA